MMRNKMVMGILILVCVILTGCGGKFDTSCYDDVLSEESTKARGGQLYYQFGYVDADNIPELFVVRGTIATDTVSIYTYNTKENKPVYVGDFGSSGYCNYVPRKNQIISVYGNMGAFYVINTGIDEKGVAYFKDAILRNMGMEKTESFYGFPVGNFTGAMPVDDGDSDNIEWPNEEYKIDEEEADKIEIKLLGDEDSIRVSPDNMILYNGQ